MNAQATTIQPFWPKEKDPTLIAKKAIDYLLRNKNFMTYNTGSVRGLHYAEAGVALGAARLAGLLKDEGLLDELVERYRPEKLPKNTANHVDVNAVGIIPLELYIQRGDNTLLEQGLALADGQWENPHDDGLSRQTRFWIDDVWMIGILQVEAFRATGKQIYLERAALEIAAYLKKLQRPNGLFYHGPMAPHHWGRGNGWVAAGLAEVLSVLPKNNPHYKTLLDGYKKMMAALLEYQASDGMWRQLIDHEEAWKETSCTAMFGYAITVGVKKGLLPGETYKPAARQAWLALTEYVDKYGRVKNVCTGTGQKDDVEFYLKRPKILGDNHAQAPLIWFAYALLADYSQ